MTEECATSFACAIIFSSMIFSAAYVIVQRWKITADLAKHGFTVDEPGDKDD